MADTGWLNPNSVVNLPMGYGFSWGNIHFVKISDNNRAIRPNMGTNKISDAIKVYNFNANIPAGNAVVGIKVRVEKLASRYNIKDYASPRMVRDGTIEGDIKNNPDWFPVSEQYVEYGGEGDLWGLTWTLDQINSSATGFIQCIKQYVNLGNTYIDNMQMKVYYSPAGPSDVDELNGVDSADIDEFNGISWSDIEELKNGIS